MTKIEVPVNFLENQNQFLESGKEGETNIKIESFIAILLAFDIKI